MFSRRKRIVSVAPVDVRSASIQMLLRHGSATTPVTGVHPDGGTSRHEKNGKSIASLMAFSIILLVAACVYMSNAIGSATSNVTSSNSGATITATTAAVGPPRFITVVIPSVVDHPTRHRRVLAIADTWARSARALIVVHNLTEEYPTALPETIWNQEQEPADKHIFPQVLHLPRNITMNDNDGFLRLVHVIRHVYHQQNADFIFLVNDHSYVIPEHLCHYLAPYNPNSDLFAGHAMKNPSVVFNSGAAGYLLSRKTMKRLLHVWDEGKEEGPCQADQDYLRSNPDLVVSECLQNILHVPALDTRGEGIFHRFHTYGLVKTVLGKVDDWFVKVHDRFQNVSGFDESYRTLLTGSDCCASDSISFHYVEYGETRALFEIRQQLVRNPEMADGDLNELLEQQWPRHDLGAYSMSLPTQDGHMMEQFKAVLRKMSRPEFQAKC